MGFPSHPSFSSEEQGGQGGGRSHRGSACGRGLGTTPDFHLSSCGTPGVPGALGSGAGRVPFSPLSLSPQKSASSSPNISRSRASARARNRSFQIAHFHKDLLQLFRLCLPHLMLLSLDYFLSHFFSFSPLFTGLPPLSFSPHNLAYSLQPLPLSWCEQGWHGLSACAKLFTY